VEFLRARYGRVERWLQRAEAAVRDDDARARVLTVRGATATDVSEYRVALRALRAAVGLASDDRHRSYALSMLGRAHLLRGELPDAAAALDASLELAQRVGWTAFVPWPESLRAHVDLARGALGRAQDRLEHAFALGCHVGDPCWEGVSARGLGLLHAARGDVDVALRTLQDARSRCTRLPDGYLWLDAWALDALCAVATTARDSRAGAWAGELSALAERAGMRELAVRALVHRAAAGERHLFDVAAASAEAVDNPALALNPALRT
jgi:tetratricopeptide (TPR) repeat protein